MISSAAYGKDRWTSVWLLMAILLIGLFFRMPYFWRQVNWDIWRTSEDRAKSYVLESVRKQVKAGLKEKLGLGARLSKEAVEDEVVRIIARDAESYQKTVVSVEARFARERAGIRNLRRYLLESDPYYYYTLTKRIITTGSISDQIKDGKFFNPFRLAPQGTWDWINLHPYFGAYWYKTLRLFCQIDLMQALCFYPLIFVFLSVVAFFLLGSVFGAGRLSIAVGCIAFLLAPIYVQRSSYGWYDTDPYQYLISVLFILLYAKGIQSARFFWLFAAACGALMGLFSVLWGGWQAIFGLCVFALCCGLVVAWFLEEERAKQRLFFICIFVVVALVCAAFFMTPGAFREQYGRHVATVSQLKGQSIGQGSFPSVFFAIGELASVYLLKAVFLLGNPLSCLLALGGVIWSGYFFWRKKDKARLILCSIVFGYALPAFVMVKGAQRFVGFLVLPFAFFVMAGTDRLMRLLDEQVRGGRLKSFLQASFLILFLGPIVLQSYFVAMRSPMIMNQTWERALDEIKSKTSKDTIVNSWWNPGYFIVALSERRSIADGGTLTEAQNYWIAKALMSPNEEESVGLFRMIDASGNQASELLLSKGLSVQNIAANLPILVRMSREAAIAKSPPQLSSQEKVQLIDLIHGKSDVPPAYLLIFSEMIKNNIEISIVATWDFNRAQMIDTWSRTHQHLNQAQVAALMQQDRVLKYLPEGTEQKRVGDVIYFTNGLEINPVTKQAHIDRADLDRKGDPFSLFYMAGDDLIEKKLMGENPVDISALLVDSPAGFTGVAADPNLIRSMLFRLYYLRGRGLKFFKPAFQEDDPITGTSIYIFEIDWEAFEKGISADKSDKEGVSSVSHS